MLRNGEFITFRDRAYAGYCISCRSVETIEAFVCSTFAAMNSVQTNAVKVTQLSTPELKFLLKLLGHEDYLAPLELLKPSPKVAKADLLAIAQSLQAQDLIDYRSEIERFSITQRGRALFKIELAARPATPDEWRVLQSCRKGAIVVEQISAKVPHEARQDLLQNLEQREFIKVLRRGAADVKLTLAGKAFLRRYRPSGCQAVLSLDLLTHYLNFMALTGEPETQFEDAAESSASEALPVNRMVPMETSAIA